MRTNQFLFRKRAWLHVQLAIIITLAMLLGSCKSNTGSDKEKQQAISQDISCLVLTSTQLDNWFPKYTKPGLAEKDKLVYIKFYVSQVPGSDAIKVEARGFDNSDSPLGSSLTLADGLACGVQLPPYLIGKSYDVKLSDLNIINSSDGRLVANFDKIVMRPMVYQQGSIDVLQFEMEVYIGNAPSQDLYVLPCPPCYNCRPVPDTCIRQDSTAITPVDTTGSN